MLNSQTPKWIRYLERKIPWLAIPNIAIILVTLQAFGFLFVLMDPIWQDRLILIPELAKNGEFWRVITFLAVPISTSPIWAFFSLWFLYFVVNAIETEWGAFKTTLYVVTSVLLTLLFSFAFNFPVSQISGFVSTLFLAAAALFPEMQILVFFVIPVKMKWLARFTLLLVVINFISTDWLSRGYLLAIYSNYLLFFGAANYYQVKQVYRRWQYQSKLRK